MNPNVLKVINDQILKLLESGVAPWRRPWSTDYIEPKNYVSRKSYQASYLNHWIRSIKEDNSILVKASGQATKAFNLITKNA